jgi:hypothetical protein
LPAKKAKAKPKAKPKPKAPAKGKGSRKKQPVSVDELSVSPEPEDPTISSISTIDVAKLLGTKPEKSSTTIAAKPSEDVAMDKSTIVASSSPVPEKMAIGTTGRSIPVMPGEDKNILFDKMFHPQATSTPAGLVQQLEGQVEERKMSPMQMDEIRSDFNITPPMPVQQASLSNFNPQKYTFQGNAPNGDTALHHIDPNLASSSLPYSSPLDEKMKRTQIGPDSQTQYQPIPIPSVAKSSGRVNGQGSNMQTQGEEYDWSTMRRNDYGNTDEDLFDQSKCALGNSKLHIYT